MLTLHPAPLRSAFTFMQPQSHELTPFGRWLTRAREARGLSINRFAADVGISNAHVSKMEAGKSNPSRDMVQRLAAALAGPDADEYVAVHLLNEGLKAAGFATTEPDDFAPEHPVIDYLHGKPKPMLDKAMKLLQAAFEEEDAADNSVNVGKRAE